MKKFMLTLIAFTFIAGGAAIAGTGTAEKDTKAAPAKPADKAEKSAPAPKEGEKPAAEKAKK